MCLRKALFTLIFSMVFISGCVSGTEVQTNKGLDSKKTPLASNSVDKTTVDNNQNAPDLSGGDHYVMPEQPAFAALPIAEAEAKKWKKGAVLYQIPRLRQMETNLNIPAGPIGWFFAFKDPTDGSDVEFYVEVINGEVVGKTEVSQILGGAAPLYQIVEIDMTKGLIDSHEAYKIYMQNGGDKYLKDHGRVELDFQLIRLADMENPVWSLFDTADLSAPPLINIDAVSGAIVEDPFAFLRE